MNRRIDSRGKAAFGIRMTARLLLLAATSAAFAANTAVPEVEKTTKSSVVPQRFEESRYEKLRSNAPFALATAEAPKEVVEPWAQNLYLGSAAKLKDAGTEKDWVVIKDRTQPGTLIQLTGTDENDGLQLVKLEWAEDPRKTKATVKKDTEFATLEFDQMAFTASAAPVPMPQPGGGQKMPQPSVVPRQPGLPPAMPVPAGSNAIRPPSSTGTINRPTVPGGMGVPRPPVSIPRPSNLPPAIGQPGMPQNPAMAPTNNTRQRIRVIPSNPTQ